MASGGGAGGGPRKAADHARRRLKPPRAIAAFELVCDLAIEALDQFRYELGTTTENVA